MKLLRLSLPVVAFLLLWELVSHSGAVNAALFPPPTKVASALAEMIRSGEILRDMRASYWRLFVGLCGGTAAGVSLGLLTGRVRVISEVLTPLIQLFRPLPPVAIIPLVIVWFGIGEAAKFFSIGFAIFFPVWLNTHVGAQQVPQKLLWSASTLTSSRWKIFSRVVYPAALPFIVAGLRVGISIAFVMVFVAELAGASEGIGYQISTAHLAYRIDRMIASLAVLGASGAIADYLFTKGSLSIYPWLKFSQTK